MENRKLIIVDLDGTALHDHIELNPETKEALIACMEAGHTVAIATGRPKRGSQKFYQELGLSTPSINFNGSYIHHPGDENFKEIIAEIPISTIVEIFSSEINDYLLNAICEYKDHLYVMKEGEMLQSWFYSDQCETVQFGPFQEILDNNPSGFILHAKPGYEQKVMDYLRANYSDIVTCRQWAGEYENIIEVFKSDSNKGTALAQLAEYLGFEPEDIIVFGDGDNDIEMFQYAGTSVAMENALEELKAVSTAITKANDQGGVATYLYENLLK